MCQELPGLTEPTCPPSLVLQPRGDTRPTHHGGQLQRCGCQDRDTHRDTIPGVCWPPWAPLVNHSHHGRDTRAVVPTHSSTGICLVAPGQELGHTGRAGLGDTIPMGAGPPRAPAAVDSVDSFGTAWPGTGGSPHPPRVTQASLPPPHPQGGGDTAPQELGQLAR